MCLKCVEACHKAEHSSQWLRMGASSRPARYIQSAEPAYQIQPPLPWQRLLWLYVLLLRMTLRKDLIMLLSDQPRSVSSIARELGLSRGDVEEDLRHALRSARAAGHRIAVLPARCRTCGFTFDEQKLSKPSKCPACRGTRIYEPQISVERQAEDG